MLMTSFNPNYLLIDPVSKYSHIGVTSPYEFGVGLNSIYSTWHIECGDLVLFGGLTIVHPTELVASLSEVGIWFSNFKTMSSYWYSVMLLHIFKL